MDAAPSSAGELISVTLVGEVQTVSLPSGLVVIQKSCFWLGGRSETKNIVLPSAVMVGEKSLYFELTRGPKFLTTSFAKALLPVSSGVIGGTIVIAINVGTSGCDVSAAMLATPDATR